MKILKIPINSVKILGLDIEQCFDNPNSQFGQSKMGIPNTDFDNP